MVARGRGPGLGSRDALALSADRRLPGTWLRCSPLAAPAFAVAPGRNGRIAFTSGRDRSRRATTTPRRSSRSIRVNPSRARGGDSHYAQPRDRTATPAWSPDRTKIVFAAGTSHREPADRGVRPLREGHRQRTRSRRSTIELGDDPATTTPRGRPTARGSPTSTSPPTNSAERDIKIKTASASAAPAVNLTTTQRRAFPAQACVEPELSDRCTSRRAPCRPNAAGENFDIVSKSATAPAAGADAPPSWHTAASEYQPSISPDGSEDLLHGARRRLSRPPTEVYIQDLPTGGNTRNISDNPGGRRHQLLLLAGRQRRSPSRKGIFGDGQARSTESANRQRHHPAGVPAVRRHQAATTSTATPTGAIDGSPDCPDTNVTAPRSTRRSRSTWSARTPGPRTSARTRTDFIANDAWSHEGHSSATARRWPTPRR